MSYQLNGDTQSMYMYTITYKHGYYNCTRTKKIHSPTLLRAMQEYNPTGNQTSASTPKH